MSGYFLGTDEPFHVTNGCIVTANKKIKISDLSGHINQNGYVDGGFKISFVYQNETLSAWVTRSALREINRRSGVVKVSTPAKRTVAPRRIVNTAVRGVTSKVQGFVQQVKKVKTGGCCGSRK